MTDDMQRLGWSVSTVAERLYGEAWWKARSVEEAEAMRKRARKAAKREEDARRTAEGRAKEHTIDPRDPRGIWDLVCSWCRRAGKSSHFTPRWRARIEHRRSLPWVGQNWAWIGEPPDERSGAQWRRAELQQRRLNRRMRRGAR